MITRHSPSKVVSGCLGLAGFALAIFAGLAVGNPPTDTLSRALVALVMCQAIGFMLGWVAEGAINRRLAELRDAEARQTARADEGSPPRAAQA